MYHEEYVEAAEFWKSKESENQMVEDEKFFAIKTIKMYVLHYLKSSMGLQS